MRVGKGTLLIVASSTLQCISSRITVVGDVPWSWALENDSTSLALPLLTITSLSLSDFSLAPFDLSLTAFLRELFLELLRADSGTGRIEFGLGPSFLLVHDDTGEVACDLFHIRITSLAFSDGSLVVVIGGM